MTAALYIVAALLMLLQLWDGWTTYQVLKHGGTESNPVVKWFMERLGVYGALLVVKGGAVALVWGVALAPQAMARLTVADMRAWDTMTTICLVGLAGLALLYVWVAAHNWRQRQKQKEGV